MDDKKAGKKRRRLAVIGGAVVVVAALALAASAVYGQAQMKKLAAMSFDECLAYTLEDNAEAVLSVGVIRDGRASYTVYGADGNELPPELHTYEIGSLTKTFTAALVQKAANEGRLDLDATLDAYLPLPAENSYPTLAALLTHTSGYRGFDLAAPLTANFLAGDGNVFYGVRREAVMEKLATLDKPHVEYDFAYSNFGYAALSLVLEAVYAQDYAALVNDFAAGLGLSATHISDGGGDLGRYWQWQEGDVYLAAGALTSNIEDMLAYAQLQLDGGELFDACHQQLREIEDADSGNAELDIRLDAIGMAWIIDAENGIVWHNGGTSEYNCYLGFCPQSGTAVVILSNLPDDYRIPATVIGVKLLTRG